MHFQGDNLCKGLRFSPRKNMFYAGEGLRSVHARCALLGLGSLCPLGCIMVQSMRRG